MFFLCFIYFLYIRYITNILHTLYMLYFVSMKYYVSIRQYITWTDNISACLDETFTTGRGRPCADIPIVHESPQSLRTHKSSLPIGDDSNLRMAWTWTSNFVRYSCVYVILYYIYSYTNLSIFIHHIDSYSISFYMIYIYISIYTVKWHHAFPTCRLCTCTFCATFRPWV